MHFSPSPTILIIFSCNKILSNKKYCAQWNFFSLSLLSTSSHEQFSFHNSWINSLSGSIAGVNQYSKKMGIHYSKALIAKK